MGRVFAERPSCGAEVGGETCLEESSSSARERKRSATFANAKICLLEKLFVDYSKAEYGR